MKCALADLTIFLLSQSLDNCVHLTSLDDENAKQRDILEAARQ